MDPKSDEGIFLRYSTNSRAYRVFKSKTKAVMESINVVINDVPENIVPDVEPDVETSVQETVTPINVNEFESENGNKIMCHQVKVLLSEFRRIILKSLLLGVLIKQTEDPME